MKKLLVGLITILGIVCSIAFVGCGEHVHSWSEQWAKDASGHWKTCFGCEEIKDKAEHDGELCSICGYQSEHVHQWQEDWSKNETEHFIACSTCSETKNNQSHNGAICLICGYDDGTIATWSGNASENVPENVDNVITISTAEELSALAVSVNASTSYQGVTIVLANDINLDNKDWTPIGNSSNKFSGVFDGNNKTIYNLKAGEVGKSDIGLFGFTTNGEIKNLTVANATITGRLNVGVVAGTPYTSKYTNITVKGLVKVEGLSYVGGVLGKNAYANLTDITVNVLEGSYVKAHSIEYSTKYEKEVAYRTYVGGVVGFMGEGNHVVKNVVSNINVLGSTQDVGGIAGIAHYGNSFINCSSSGNVSIYLGDVEDPKEIGGIAGVWHNEQDVVLENCSFTGTLNITYADGTVYDGEFANGGLCGVAYSSSGEGELIIR
jgi:hypothetical protein